MSESKIADPKICEFLGDVCVWKPWSKSGKVRRWITVNLPFRDFRRFFLVLPYDHDTGRGFQRKQTESHKKNLHKAMCNDEFTPAVFSGGLLASHEKNLRFFEENGIKRVAIQVPENQKLPCMDGGHRWAALQLELAKAEQAKDEERIELVDSEIITVQIFLDSKHLQTDFLNLQKGRAMDRNQMKSMSIKNNLVDDDKLPYLKLATQVCHLLVKDKESHLFGQIQFDSNRSGPLSYNSITTMAGSELATSIGGGAKIAHWGGQDAEWLAATYIEAYHAIDEFCQRGEDDLDGEPPAILKADRMLCPPILGGTRGGSAFLVMLGNFLAFRKIWTGHQEATKEDLETLARIADDLLNKPVGGQSGEDKRREAGIFARNYFGDLQGVVRWDEVPAALVQLLSPSTLKVSRDVIPPGELKKVPDVPGKISVPTGAKPAKVSKKTAKKLQEVVAVAE